MSTLRDLRETLDERAGTVDDPERYARPVAVRARIRAARQRRAAAGGLAVAVALAVGITAVGTVGGSEPDRPEPAGAVVGVDVPQRTAVYGFPYELTGTDPLEGPDDRLRIQGNRPQAVVFAARDLGAGSATLYLGQEPVARVFGGGLSDPVPVSAGARLSVRLDGAGDLARTGLAFYRATGEPAPGVTDGQNVFRDEAFGLTRLDAAFSDTGEVELPYEGRMADLRIATGCPDAPAGAHLTVLVDDEPSSSGPCVWDGERDLSAIVDAPGDIVDGRRHEVRAVLTDGPDGPVIDDGRVGLGVYSMTTSVAGGTDVPTRIESRGRTWVLDQAEVRTFRDTDDWQDTLTAADSDLLIGVAGRTGGEGTLRIDWQGRLSRGSSPYIEAAYGAMTEGGFLPRGDTYDVRITGDDVRTAALLVYRPV